MGGYKIHIIKNSVGEFFETNDYDSYCKKQYDFITIRSNLDGSTYCIDELVRIASEVTNNRFLLIGMGDFFKHNKKPQNIDLIL